MHPSHVDRRWMLAALAAATAGLAPGLAHALPPELAAELPQARVQGQGRLRFLGLHVYDIRLWTPLPGVGAQDWALKPIALEIEYARELVGRLIAERSLEEMKRTGPIAPDAAQRWLESMQQFFPDVKPGDRIVGVQRPDGLVRFFVNGRLRGEKRDAEFARRFFGIWLAPETSEPRLREALLGRP